MGIETLTQLELLDGIIGLIYPVIGSLVGLTISSKYAKFKRMELLFMGLSLTLNSFTWIALGFTFITIVFFDFVLPDNIYFILFLGFMAPALICWMWAMSILIFPNQLKKVMAAVSVICIVYEIYLIAMLIIDPPSIVTRVSPMDVSITLIPRLFSLIALLSSVITMLIFVKNSLQSENIKIIWKGRFLLTTTIMLVIAALIVITSPTNIIIILIARIFFVVRLLFTYLGWLLPDRIAKWLIKENT